MDLEQKVDKWKKTADDLLKESQLTTVLNKNGQIIFTGSYHYELILSPDVDLYLVTEKPTRHQAVNLLNQLIEQGWWHNYEFADFVEDNFRSAGWDWLPKGYYLQLKNDYKGNRWKVDIWVLTPEECHRMSWNERLSMGKINKKQRAAILNLKDARLRKKIDATVHDIYIAVLEEGIYTEKDFMKKNFSSNTDGKVEELKLYTDGGARGNPGPAAGAYVICKMDGTVVEKSGQYLGETTNNQAEYKALKQGLEAAKKLGAEKLQVYMDSELVIKQLNGVYKIKNAELLPLYNQIKELTSSFKDVSFTHVPRAMNSKADAEVNRILDQKTGAE